MNRRELNFLTAMFGKIFLLNCGMGDCVQEETEVLLHTSRCIFSTRILTKAKLSRTENHIPATVQKWTWADPCWCKQALRETTKYCKYSTEHVSTHRNLPGFASRSATGLGHQLNKTTIACSLSVTPKGNLA